MLHALVAKHYSLKALNTAENQLQQGYSFAANSANLKGITDTVCPILLLLSMTKIENLLIAFPNSTSRIVITI